MPRCVRGSTQVFSQRRVGVTRLPGSASEVLTGYSVVLSLSAFFSFFKDSLIYMYWEGKIA